MTYYRIIGGIRYDRSLLAAADACTNQGRNEFRISLAEIQYLYRLAADGRTMTDVERRTLHYIGQHYHLTDKARRWLLEQLPIPGADDDLQHTLQRVLRQEYGLANLRYDISSATVQQYLHGGGSRDWEGIVQGAVEAFLRGSQGRLSLVARVAQRDPLYNEGGNMEALLKTYLDRSVLFLIPPDATADTPLPYDLPYLLDATNFWTFVLQCPDFEPVEFLAFVHREQPFQYSKGQFSTKAGLDAVITAAIRQCGQFGQMKWHIPVEEIQRQLALLPGQNFGNALFAVVDSGIFNQESSTSFADFLRQEIWPDPEVALREIMRAYADTGTLHLIPLDYRAQTNSGTAAFPVPEQHAFWMDGEWVFGLEMPRSTAVRLFLTTRREASDGDLAWNDGFVHDPLPIGEQLQKVVTGEFQLDGLQITVSEAAFEAQRQQFGPDWRQLPALLRQALNTLLHDYLSPNGVFNGTANANREAVDPTHFEETGAYRAAIRHLIKGYLRAGGTLEFLPGIPEENPLPGGEKAEQNWLFRAVLPSLADHYFWIVIPRWPEEEQRPYNYIG